MKPRDRQRVERIEAEHERLRARVQLRPLSGGKATRPDIFQIIGGQSLPVIGRAGIKVALTVPASIPDYDLTTSPTTVDGIGYGRNLFTGALTLLALCPPSTFRWDLQSGQVVDAIGKIQILITASSPARYRSAFVISSVRG